MFIPTTFFPIGIAFIFYFLSFWFCKDTIQEEERSKHKQSFKVEEEGLKENDEEEKHAESVI